MSISANTVLDRRTNVEVTLELLSYSGGENTISEDHVCKDSEARVCKNWDAISLGGMERTKGFNEVADGGVAYSDEADLLIQHDDAGGTVTYGIIGGDLVKKDSSDIIQEDAAAFTSGVLSHGVSAGGYLWITNATDNLQQKAVGVAIAASTDQPPTACARIYNHKNRLLAEGSATFPKRVYGSRVGVGNWTAADAWDLANDAFSIDLPNDTRGCVPDFPSGNEVLVFTDWNCYAISNFPNTSFRPVSTPGRGCCAPYSIAKGNEGVYFLSRYPTLGIFLFNGVTFTELTELNKDVFVEKIDLSNRVFGVYRNRRYHIFYNEVNSGVSYPNKWRIYDAQFNRWMEREINSDLSDTFGYPAILNYSNNELYVASSQKDKMYELETADDSDEGNDTECTWTTKNFSSRDFAFISGGQFPMDEVKIKLTKVTMTYYGTVGSIGLYWAADRGLHSGSKTFSLTGSGDLINSTFEVNTSYIVGSPPDKTVTYTFPNSAVGKRFYFSITHSGSSTRPKIKKIKIDGVVLAQP